MEGKPSMQVWKENDIPKREVPAELKPYLFTHRYMRTVGKKGIFFDGGRYYAKEVIQCLGQRVQIRVPLDSDDLFYVFSLEGKKLFDAVYQDDSGTVAEQVVNGESLPADNTPEKKPVNNKLIKLFIK